MPAKGGNDILREQIAMNRYWHNKNEIKVKEGTNFMLNYTDTIEVSLTILFDTLIISALERERTKKKIINAVNLTMNLLLNNYQIIYL